MAKFLSIPVTSEGNQLVSADNIKLIEQASTTTVTIVYLLFTEVHLLKM
jgi:hypothetical protein